MPSRMRPTTIRRGSDFDARYRSRGHHPSMHSRGWTPRDDRPPNVQADPWRPVFWIGAFVFCVGVLYLFAEFALKPILAFLIAVFV